MSEPTPELRAIAARLFEAARAERPEQALGRRLELLAPRHDPGPSRPLARAARSQTARWGFAAVALCAAALLASSLVLVRKSGSGDAPVRITAEHGAAPRATVAPALEVPPRAEVERAASAALPRGAEQRSPSTAPAVAARPARALDRGRSKLAAATPARAHTTNLPAPVGKEPPRDAPEVVASAPPPVSLRAELAWLENARAELRGGHAQRAFDLLEQRGSGQLDRGLDAEATVLRIEALSALGRDREASELAARFLHEHPTSPLGDRVRSFIRNAPRAVP